MLSAGPTGLTDDLWLAAHDSVTGRAQVGEWALGVGLATGLFAELVHGSFIELHDGEFFRTAAGLPDDPALRSLLAKMQAEEPSQPPVLPPPRASVPVQAEHSPYWPAQAHHYQPSPWPASHDWPSREQPAAPPVHRRRVGQEEARHSRHGHDLRTWLSYLAYDGRAEQRVIERLARRGLIRRDKQHRLLRRPTTYWVPCDSVAAATPANMISTAVQNQRRLDRTQLCLAGLILATGLHHHALATLDQRDRSRLNDELQQRLDAPTRELIHTADITVADAAIR